MALLVISSCSPQGRPRPAPGLPPGEDARVTRVVDGDTIEVVLGGRKERVRLIGIDTPETKDPRRPVECFGKEAARRTAQLVGGEWVRLSFDVEVRDKYGRLLAYVYRLRDGLFLNLALVREGFALVYTVPPNLAHQEEFLQAQRRAREEGRGLWRSCR